VIKGGRDKLIGWTRAELLDRMRKEGGKSWAEWLLDSLRAQFEGVYLQDFLKEGVVSAKELRRPTTPVIEVVARPTSCGLSCGLTPRPRRVEARTTNPTSAAMSS
jgi:hypothetical protein